MDQFCKFCGAGIGKFRREGEGTCPECMTDDEVQLQTAINSLADRLAEDDAA